MEALNNLWDRAQHTSVNAQLILPDSLGQLKVIYNFGTKPSLTCTFSLSLDMQNTIMDETEVSPR